MAFIESMNIAVNLSTGFSFHCSDCLVWSWVKFASTPLDSFSTPLVLCFKAHVLVEKVLYEWRERSLCLWLKFWIWEWDWLSINCIQFYFCIADKDWFHDLALFLCGQVKKQPWNEVIVPWDCWGKTNFQSVLLAFSTHTSGIFWRKSFAVISLLCW